MEVKQNERRHKRLQRLYTTFPERLPGLGLLFLRVTAAGTLIFLTLCFFSEPVQITIREWLIYTAVFIFSAALLVGFLTPVFSALLATGGILFLLWFPAQINSVFAAYLIILSVLILLLGPGAYSIDARFFGLREIVISKKD